MEYEGLWKALVASEPAWPSTQKIAVVGPAGSEFAEAAVAAARAVVGHEATQFSTQPRTRWQSVRLEVTCATADDVCAVHSRLRALEGVKAVM